MAKALTVLRSGVALQNGSEYPLFGQATNTSAEANAQFSITEDMTISLLGTRIISGGSGTNNLQSRVNGANGNLLASRSGTGDAEDATNSDAVNATDLYNLAYTDNGTDSGIAWIAANVEFDSGYGALCGASAGAGQIFDVASSTRFISLSGALVSDGEATEGLAQTLVRGFTSWEALQVRVTSNARSNDSVFKNRINSGDGSSVITFASGATGLVVDDALGDALTAGQPVCVSITLDTGVQDLQVAFTLAAFKSTTTKQDVWAYAGIAGGRTRSASATAHYYCLGCSLPTPGDLTEAQARIKPGFAGTASNLRANLSADTYTGASTLKLFKNGSAVITLDLPVGGGAAFPENTTDSVTFTATDELSFEVVGGTSGSITISSLEVTLAPDVGSALSGIGAGTATATGAATAAVPISAAGSSVATASGASTATAALNAAGAATGTLVGEALAQAEAALSAAGSSVGTLDSTSTASSVLSAAGTGVGTLEGAEVAAGVEETALSTAGTSTGELSGAAIGAADLLGTGTSAGTLGSEIEVVEEPEEEPRPLDGGGAWGRPSSNRKRRREKEEEELMEIMLQVIPMAIAKRQGRNVTLH